MHQRAWPCQAKYNPVTKQACGFRIQEKGVFCLTEASFFSSVGQHHLLLFTALPRIFYATLTKSLGQSCLQSVPLPTLRQGNVGRMSKQRLGTGTGRLSPGWFVIRFQSCQYPSVFVTLHSNLSGTTLLQEKPYARWSTEFSHKKKILCFAEQSRTFKTLWWQLNQVQISIFPCHWSQTTSTFLCGWLPLIPQRGGSFPEECAGREQLLISLVKSHLLSSATLTLWLNEIVFLRQ